MKPLQIFSDWLGSQPKEVGDKIALVVGCAVLPNVDTGIGFLRFTLKSKEMVNAWLAQDTEHGMQQVARALMVRELVSLMVFRNSETTDDWEQQADERKGMLEAAKTLGYDHLTPELEANVPERPGRREEWMAAAQSWRQLRSSSLSDEALEAWFDADGKRRLGMG